MTTPYPYPVSIAPMMDWTDRHYRYFMRQLTRRTLLYTEMITTGAILHGNQARHLDFSVLEHPLALQLGGDNPEALATCASIAETWGYDEVNLNVGCPSDRVQNGNFGACLMAQPELVRDCVQAMRESTRLPITVKHRIGIDNLDSYEDMAHFVEVVAAARSAKFTVHARIAWLQGLSPKENRTVPPLRYDDIYRLKRDFPELAIELNGGVLSLEDIGKHLTQVDAVMLGRAAYQNPYLFAEVDRQIYGEVDEVPSRHDVIHAMLPYMDAMLEKGVYLSSMSRHMLQLFAGQPGAKAWKRHISENAHKTGADTRVLRDALAKVPERVQHARGSLSSNIPNSNIYSSA
ncbi:MAG: tRNA dihydrouridine(20/20a) synthase DusA [Deinococcota bacterium]